MSITQSIALHKKKLPSTSEIEAQAKAFGFDLKIKEVELKSHADFVACKLSGKKAGFDWFIDDTEICKDLGIKIGTRDCVCTLTTHSSMIETQSAMVFAAALLALTKGVYFDDYDNVEKTPDRILETVHDLMKGGKK
jgi:hypothetical protein